MWSDNGGLAQMETFKALKHETENDEDVRRVLASLERGPGAQRIYGRAVAWLARRLIACGEQLQARSSMAAARQR